MPTIDLTAATFDDTVTGHDIVLVDFWAAWCGPCRQEFPALDEMYRKYKPMGFTMVGINVESEKADAERFLGAAREGGMTLREAVKPLARHLGVTPSELYKIAAER